MDRRDLLVSCFLVITACAVVAGHSHGSRRLADLPGSLPDPSLIPAGPWQKFLDFLNFTLGDMAAGLADLKRYFIHFGYLGLGTGVTDVFDGAMLEAVKLYQQNFGLNSTGVLDASTLLQIVTPRCGREDVANGVSQMLQNLPKPPPPPPRAASPSAAVQHYSFFDGKPKWRGRSTLTYAFSPTKTTNLVTEEQRDAAFFYAFAAWSAVINLNFTRIYDTKKADITIEFDVLDHLDGEPFDGQLGILAHAFSPMDGRFHLDNAEQWVVDVKRSGPAHGIDLQSVALHELGHIIGLGHSGVVNSVMYPSISPEEAKRSLTSDDVAGAQALYGANPDYDPSAPLPTYNANAQGNSGLRSVPRAGALPFLLMLLAAACLVP